MYNFLIEKKIDTILKFINNKKKNLSHYKKKIKHVDVLAKSWEEIDSTP
jgi:hypothetical protein